MGHTYIGGKSGCKMVTLFDSYSCDGVSAGIWVIHDSLSDVGEIRVYQRADFQSGSRVLKKVF